MKFRIAIFFVIGLFVLPAFALAVAVWTTDDGIEDFHADPAAHRVAQKAYAMAWVHRDNPIRRILAPAARVVVVARVAGHCGTPKGWSGDAVTQDDRPDFPALGPGPESPYAEVEHEYVAQVHFYTFFGYPADDVYLKCGASSASSRKPPEWH